MNRSRSSRGRRRNGAVVSDRAVPQDLRRRTWPSPARRERNHRIGTVIAQAREHAGDDEHELVVGFDVEEQAQHLDRLPRTGIGKGCIPAARRKRTGGLSIARQRWDQFPPPAKSYRKDRGRADRRVHRRGYGPCVRRIERAFARSCSAPIAAPQNSARPASPQRSSVPASAGSPWRESARSPVAIDVEVGEAGSVRRMEEIRRLRQIDQDTACVGPRPPVSPLSSAMASSSAVTRRTAKGDCNGNGAIEHDPEKWLPVFG